MPHSLDLKLSPELESVRLKIEATLKPFIRIIPKPLEKQQLTLWQSKFGGLPYLPKSHQYPTDNQGNPLFLLAQINFDEVPFLNGFPTTGILQFYIADDDVFGIDFDHQTLQQNFRILYFPEVLQREDYLLTDFSFLPESTPQFFPLSTTCSLQFEAGYEPVGTSDYQFDEHFGEQFFEQFGDLEDSICDEYIEHFSSDGHKLGGYAYFTQNDPRLYLPEAHHYWLLLQMDTDDAIDMMWGDSGVGNFFIKEEDLRRLDFSNVLYNWDCC